MINGKKNKIKNIYFKFQPRNIFASEEYNNYDKLNKYLGKYIIYFCVEKAHKKIWCVLFLLILVKILSS